MRSDHLSKIAVPIAYLHYTKSFFLNDCNRCRKTDIFATTSIIKIITEKA